MPKPPDNFFPNFYTKLSVTAYLSFGASFNSILAAVSIKSSYLDLITRGCVNYLELTDSSRLTTKGGYV